MISFVILHYKNINDTIECVMSIQNLKTKHGISIVVIDNGTLSEIEKNKLQHYDVDLVLLNKNTGFANGNNQGCMYATEKYKPEFLCVINNDTIIDQENFVSIIYELDNQYHFDLLGPKIFPEESESCNPFPVYQTIKEVEDQIVYTKKLIKIYKHASLTMLLKLYSKMKSIFYKPVHHENGKLEETGIALHGCALIFSKKYYQTYKNVFYPETFLYHEEEFLFYRTQHDSLISLYSPKLQIIHKEGQSLNKKYHNERKKLYFRNKERLRSLTLLETVMKQNQSI